MIILKNQKKKKTSFPVSFSLTATGTPPLTYQWQRNGVNIPEATNANLAFISQPLSDATYSVAVFNPAGTVLSSNASLTVLIPAAILAQPQSQAVFPNTANVRFSVSAGSSTPIRYQWRFNGTNLVNQSNSSLVLTNIQANQSGPYTVLVSNSFGSILSQSATLTVRVAPAFMLSAYPVQPTNVVVPAPQARFNL